MKSELVRFHNGVESIDKHDSGSGSPTTSDTTGSVLPIAIASLIAVLALAGYAIIRNKYVAE